MNATKINKSRASNINNFFVVPCLDLLSMSGHLLLVPIWAPFYYCLLPMYVQSTKNFIVGSDPSGPFHKDQARCVVVDYETL